MHVELRNIHKHYGSLQANRGIDLEVLPGSVHGLLGENGAGKSTLVKILAGYVPMTSGAIRIDGQERRLTCPADAARLGIGMLYQDPLDFPSLTVLENFRLTGGPAGRQTEAQALHTLETLAGKFDFSLDPGRTVARLSLGERQQFELLRLLALGVRILILDEPTTGITDLQKEVLFRALRQVAAAGRSVILVSHKLGDVEVLCDRVTILQQGRVAGSVVRPFATADLLRMMFGTLPTPPPRSQRRGGEPILSFRDVSAPGGRSGLRNCNAAVRRGEVVGLAGVEGSGQGVFLRLAAGLRRPHRGRVEFDGRPLPHGHRRARRRLGITFLPAERLEEGLIEGLTLLEHFALNGARIPFLAPWTRAEAAAADGIRRYRIRGAPADRVESLSGGNQQRLLLSFIPPDASLLLLENPTRGLDAESANGVWQELQRHRSRGSTILFSSSELDEILEVADRILVFHDGAIVHDTAVAAAVPETLSRAIAGRPCAPAMPAPSP